MGRDTLLTATLGDQGTLKKVLLVLAGSLFIAAAAKVTVPMWPVPISLQTLAILLVGFSMGSRLGAATVVVYLAQGAMGLPVFTPTTLPGIAGAAWATAASSWGFVGPALVAGYAAERGLARASSRLPRVALGPPRRFSTSPACSGRWRWRRNGPGCRLDRQTPASMGPLLAPFLLGDMLKSVIAALVVTGAGGPEDTRLIIPKRCSRAAPPGGLFFVRPCSGAEAPLRPDCLRADDLGRETAVMLRRDEAVLVVVIQ